jgi:hypothetical protein
LPESKQEKTTSVFEAGGRGNGKTSRLVEAVKANPNALMICHTYGEAQRIKRQYGLGNHQVTCLHEWTTRPFKGGDWYKRDLYLDNIDLMINELLGGRVVRATYTEEA